MRLLSLRSPRAAASLLMCLGLALGSSACSSEEVIVKTTSGVELKAADIDSEPLALVPPGALAVVNVQPKELFASPLGHRFLVLAQSQFPLPPSTGFDVQRDLERLIVGVYSAAGIDFSGVAVGRFDVAAIKAAAEKSEATPLGTPLVPVRYSQWDFYVSANIGFCVLTPRTVLFGNEVGIRRALDRLERGDLRVSQDPDVEALMRNPGAPMALGLSNGDAALNAVLQRTPLGNNLRVARVVANLQPPGLNVAGTFTFADAASADAAKSGFEQLFAALRGLEAVGALFGVQPTSVQHQVQLVETSVQVTAATETQVAERLLTGLNEFLPQRTPSAP